jgi:hypothetical protein
MLRLDPYAVKPHWPEEVDNLRRVKPFNYTDDLPSLELPLDPVLP